MDKRKTNQFYQFILATLRLYWGNPETRLLKIIVVAGLALLASPIWELLIFLIAREKNSAIIDRYQDGSQITGFILLSIGVGLFVWLKCRKPPVDTAKIKHLELKNVALEEAISELKTIASSRPFKDKPKGFKPAPHDIINTCKASFNKYGEVFVSCSQRLSQELAESLQALYDDTNEQIAKVAAASILGNQDNIEIALKKMTQGMPRFGKQLREAVKSAHRHNTTQIESLLK